MVKSDPPGSCFELLDHTADVMVRLRADRLEGLVSCAAAAIRWLLFGDVCIEDRAASREIDEEADSFAEALIAFCNDLLYDSWVRRLVPLGLDFARWEPPVLRTRVLYGALPEDLGPERELKAATYAALEVRREGRDWVLDVTFDV